MGEPHQQIVVAWADKTALVPTGRHVRRDRNYFPEFKPDWEGKAVMWKRHGGEADLKKAQEWAEREGHIVFTFSADEPDPLGKAKALACASARQGDFHAAP